MKGNNVTVIAPQSLTKSVLRGIPIIKRHSSIPLSNGNKMTLYRPFYISFGNNKKMKKFNEWFFNKSVERALSKIKEIPTFAMVIFEAVYYIYPFAKNNIPLIASSGEELITFHNDYSEDDLKGGGYVKGLFPFQLKIERIIGWSCF